MEITRVGNSFHIGIETIGKGIFFPEIPIGKNIADGRGTYISEGRNRNKGSSDRILDLKAGQVCIDSVRNFYNAIRVKFSGIDSLRGIDLGIWVK